MYDLHTHENLFSAADVCSVHCLRNDRNGYMLLHDSGTTEGYKHSMFPSYILAVDMEGTRQMPVFVLSPTEYPQCFPVIPH